MAKKYYYKFSKMLTSAVRRIADKHEKTIAAVHNELGRAIGRDKGTSIEYWRKGKGIPKPADLEKLASKLVELDGLTPEELKEFGHSARYPELVEKLGPEIFAKKPNGPKQTKATTDERPPIEPAVRVVSGPILHPRQFFGREREQKSSPTPEQTEVTTDDIDPFVISGPILYPRQFFGRERELKRIFGLLNRLPLQHIAVIGKRSSGKTSLLKYLQAITTTPKEKLRDGQRHRWLSRPNTYRWVFVDFRLPQMRKLQRFMQHVLKELNVPVPDPLELEGFLDLVIEQSQTPTVILMDDIGKGLAAPELDKNFWQSLRALAGTQTNGNLACILTARDYPDVLAEEHGKASPFFNMFYPLTLGPLTEKEARELIDNLRKPSALGRVTDPKTRELITNWRKDFPDADIEWILTHSRRWPCALQTLCFIREMGLKDGDTSEEWKQEGLTNIERFKHLWEGGQ